MRKRDARNNRRAASVAACLVLALAAWTGCVTESGGRSAASGSQTTAIEEINILAVPVALNLDQFPGLDGFVIKVYAGNRANPKPIKIQAGAIEVFMFDGILGVTAGSEPEPLRSWQYTAAEVQQFEIESSIGTGYQLALFWGDVQPSGNRISVAVRYTPPQGRPVTSRSSIISVALK